MDLGKEYRCGNYSITKIDQAGVEYINVMSLAGQWGLCLACVSQMAAFIEILVDDFENYGTALTGLLTSMFGVTTIVDAKVHKKVLKVLADYTKDVKVTEPTDKTDEEIIQDMKTLHEMKEAAEQNEKEMKEAENEQVQG